MNLLGAVCYDPSTAASKATSALLAMTAFDTTNLRATVTVPAHGKLRFRIFGGAITGATTLPTILIGFLSGATVIARVTPRDFPATMNATTQTVPIEADFTVTGLAAGSITLDLAYAVQVIVASTTIKYGGPNTNAGANAWGAMCFEVWDPQPLAISSAALLVDSGGLVSSNLTKVNGTAQTAKDLGAQLDATISSRMATYAQPTGFLTATFPTTVASTTNITAASGVALAASQHVIVDSGTVTTVTNQLTAAQIATGVWQDATAGDFTAASSIGKSLYTSGVIPGAAGGLFIAGTNAATTITTALTTTFTGNVTGSVGSVTGAVGSVTGAVGSVTGNVGGNVVGSVASVTAAVTLPSIPTNWITAAGITAAALNGKGDWPVGKTGYSLTTADWAKAGDAMTLTVAYDAAKTAASSADYTAARALKIDNLDAAISTRSTYAGGDTAGTTTLLARVTATRAGNLDSLDATVSSRLASASYTAPDNASVTAIKAKTDSLTFTVAGKLDGNVTAINGVAILGDGSASPFHI